MEEPVPFLKAQVVPNRWQHEVYGIYCGLIRTRNDTMDEFGLLMNALPANPARLAHRRLVSTEAKGLAPPRPSARMVGLPR